MSEQCKQTRERANVQASGPLHMSGFLVGLDHSGIESGGLIISRRRENDGGDNGRGGRKKTGW